MRTINYQETFIKPNNAVITIEDADDFCMWSYTIEREDDYIIINEQHKGYSQGCFWTEPRAIGGYYDNDIGVVQAAQIFLRGLHG